MDIDLDAAESYCDIVDLDWSLWTTKEPVVWFQSPESSGTADWHWRIVRPRPGRPSQSVDEEVCSLLGNTFFLKCLRNRMLALGKKSSVFYSPTVVEQDIIWPRSQRVYLVQQLSFHPSCSDEDASEIFMNRVKNLWRDQSLVVHGFPSSDFCINVMYAFGHLFEKVGLVRPSGSYTTVLFYSFRKWELAYEIIRSNFRAMTESQDVQNLGIFSMAEKKNLSGSIFYSFYLYMNCIHLKKQVIDIVQKIRQSKELSHAC